MRRSRVEELEAEEAEGAGPCKHTFKMLPFLGVNCHIKSKWRYLHSTFGRIWPTSAAGGDGDCQDQPLHPAFLDPLIVGAETDNLTQGPAD